MTKFETKYFQRFKFEPSQIKRYFENALRDFTIAKDDAHLEVRFNYCYNSLIKAGIALLAASGGVKVRSIVGHHIKIIEKMAEILKDDSIITIANAMRMKRNEDLYGGGIFISEKEVEEYLEYTGNLINKVKIEIAID